ncbi:M23 family metallopeptidase [Frigoribacterium sp. VKM Ac-1396]|uniref:M23 family metallopeptidase n=1 Tax=Frigoribacterium sp. VKM Ac-1396 TaxID=2783821 RepID=UPI00188D532D|nr:M23 family metallopeptidase [Frigoribacterium sp. VKM Ac-1396]MBF4601842.1 M23 family metallopeptidase [Frigoribacterium sp. VKM Ac-1396]
MPPSDIPSRHTSPLPRRARAASLPRRAWAASVVLALALLATVFVPDPAVAAVPTWQAVVAARDDETAKKKALADIQTALDDASARADAARASADEAGRVLGDAQAAVDEATARHEQLETRRAEARETADSARRVVGQAAALMARPGSGGMVGDLLSAGDGARDVLRGLSLSSKLGENVGRLRERAQASDNLATSLAEQAAVALAERDRLAGDAQAALDEAAAASVSAEADLAAVDDERATLAAQAALLEDDRLTLEQAYAQAQAAAAAAAAAAARPAPVAGGGTGPVAPGTGGPGPGVVVPDPGTGWVTAIRSYGSYQAYGYRTHPITGEYKLHAGADFGATCGTPIYAVSAGRVSYAGPSSGYGNLIVVDHGGGVSSAYAHMERSGVYVSVGQQVEAGQNIAGVGTSGGSTGCHLHLEVRLGGVATDPVAFLATKGVR